MRRTFIAIASVAVSVLAGCGTHEVYQVALAPVPNAENPQPKLAGIPFYRLVPVNKATEQRVQQYARIELKLKATFPLAGGKTRTTATNWIFYSDSLRTDPNSQNGAKPGDGKAASAQVKANGTEIQNGVNDREERDASTLIGEIRAKLNGKTVEEVIAGLDAIEQKHFQEPRIFDDVNEVRAKLKRVASVRTIEQRPSFETYTLNAQAPWGGTASVDMGLDSRGVLTTAKGEKNDAAGAAAVTGATGILSAGLSAGLGGAATVASAGIAARASIYSAVLAKQAVDPNNKVNGLKALQGLGLLAQNDSLDATQVSTLDVEINSSTVTRLYTVSSSWAVTRHAGVLDTSPNACDNSPLGGAGECLVEMAVDLGTSPPKPSESKKDEPQKKE